MLCSWSSHAGGLYLVRGGVTRRQQDWISPSRSPGTTPPLAQQPRDRQANRRCRGGARSPAIPAESASRPPPQLASAVTMEPAAGLHREERRSFVLEFGLCCVGLKPNTWRKRKGIRCSSAACSWATDRWACMCGVHVSGTPLQGTQLQRISFRRKQARLCCSP